MRRKIYGLVAFSLVFASLVSAKTWSRKMQELSQVFPELLLDVSSEKRFNDPRNARRIRKNVEKLKNLAHNVAKAQKTGKGKATDTDPSIGMISSMFEEETDRAALALKEGHRDYARVLLKSVATYCIACHTRDDQGPDYPVMKFKVSTKSLSLLEKADLLAATRQFDRALAAYKKLAQDAKFAKKHPFDWEKAVKRGLTVAVRVKKDPAQALQFLKPIDDIPRTALFLKAEAVVWRKSLNEWNKEPERRQKTVVGYFAEANLLLNKAREAQKYPADESGNVYYLRASAVLHDLLRMKLSPRQKAKAYLLTGICYEAINDLRMWSLPEVYYENCIQNHPKSKTSQECFVRYERSIYRGYSGSGGVSIPFSVERKLNKLRKDAIAK